MRFGRKGGLITFLIGLAMLAAGGAVYGHVCERVMKPTDNPTPATAQRDDVDFVPMKKWRNSLIELLNIAGTGPILGPIQGALFGPIAFVTIPVGCVIAGAFHDYMVGMISIRNKGVQTPSLVRLFLGKRIYAAYTVFVCLLLLLIGVVFVYTPGDIFVTQILHQESTLANPVLWAVYGVIFAYYVMASLLPIDKVIGRVYPVLGAILLISAVGVFVGLFANGYKLPELWDASAAGFPMRSNFVPIFFVTVTCGILSGFHSTQATLVSRTVANEREGRTTFYNMMIAEGFVAMTWAAGAMGAMMQGLAGAEELWTSPTSVVGIVFFDMLGPIGGLIALAGVIVLPITSGDTALRGLRCTLGDTLGLDMKRKGNILKLAIPIFAVVFGVLVWSKSDADGFNVLWRYFSWANETIAVFALTMIAMYMAKNRMPYVMALVPGAFYLFVVTSYILNAHIGLNLSWGIAYALAGASACAYVVLLVCAARRNRHVGCEGDVSCPSDALEV